MQFSKISSKSKELLNQLGILPIYKGYEQLILAIYYYINRNKEYDFNMNEDIYEKVAEKADSTTMRVERCLRTIFQKNANEIKKYFKVKSKITNKLALILISNEVEELSNGKLLSSQYKQS